MTSKAHISKPATQRPRQTSPKRTSGRSAVVLIRLAPQLVLVLAMLAVALMPIGAAPAAGQSDSDDRRWLQIDTSVLRTLSLIHI